MVPHWYVVLPLVLRLAAPVAATEAGPTADRWTWPVSGPVLRPFDPPEDPYGTGHRGIDIGGPIGTPIVAVDDGTVSFAGPIGGQLFVTLDHGGGLTSTYSWLSVIEVRKGQVVLQGDRIGLTGPGHPGSVVPHLHLGARLDGSYVDPMALLDPPPVSDLIHLAPDPTPGGA